MVKLYKLFPLKSTKTKILKINKKIFIYKTCCLKRIDKK